MLEVGSIAIEIHDAIRLLAVPLLGYAAWRDLRTRRVTNRLWPPLLVIGLGALLLEALEAQGAGTQLWREFLLATGLSIGLLVPLAYGFWYIGGFGGADAKAIMVLAVVFPTVPTIDAAATAIPVIEPAAGVFSLSILTNAVLVGLLYPLGLALRNGFAGEFSLDMFLGRYITAERAASLPGRLGESADGHRSRGLDLDALRMYLRWRDITIEDLRADPIRYRQSRPDDPQPIGDGAIADGGSVDDPWAAEAFIEAAPHGVYGTTPAVLREGLAVLSHRDRVWYVPGIPFILLIAGGLVVALTVGDLFQPVLGAIGLG